ncbi:MAG TPA: hypothetical protein VGF20_13610 [Candidatus Acidoferrum sp.]
MGEMPQLVNCGAPKIVREDLVGQLFFQKKMGVGSALAWLCLKINELSNSGNFGNAGGSLEGDLLYNSYKRGDESKILVSTF